MKARAAGGTPPSPSGPTPNTDEVRSHLAKVTSSTTFVDSARLTRFLGYLVEETLAGRGPLLKEYKVGLDVFDRPESFDPRTDSVVRAQATRLRSKLDEYYSGEGASDSIEIELPRGSYVPGFTRRSAQAAPAQQATPGSRRSILLAAGLILAAVAALLTFFLVQRERPPAATPPSATSVAVLPFLNMSADKDNDYFSDGLTEEIIDALAKVNGLRVVARTSAFQFKGHAQDIRQIGLALNVATILEGSVRKTGHQLRVTAQLNDVANGYHLWSQTFDAGDQDIFHVQSEIAGAICRTLLSAQAPSTGLVRPGTSNPEAYNLYLQGLYFWNQWTREASLKAVNYLHQAINLDPHYAQAYALLGDTYTVLGGPLGLHRDENLPKALASAQKALELDPDLAAAHSALGMYHAIYSWDWAQADRHLARALELEPGAGRIHDGSGWYMTTVGKFAEAEIHLKRAVELDPLSFSAMTELGTLFICQNRPEEALQQFKKVQALNRQFLGAQTNMSRLLADLGRFQEAQAVADHLPPGDRAGEILLNAYIHARRGDRSGALELLTEARKYDSDGHTRPVNAARVYMILGDSDGVIEQLGRAYDQRDAYFVYAICALRDFRPLYSDPRFIALKRKIGK